MAYCNVDRCIRQLRNYKYYLNVIKQENESKTLPFDIERTCPHTADILNDCPKEYNYKTKMKRERPKEITANNSSIT